MFNKGQKGFKAWHLVVRRYDRRNTSDRSLAYAALISNISESDGAKDVEQFGDILRNIIDETYLYEGRFGKIPDEEKTLAVKKLMPESLLNYRFRSTTLPYEELLISLENMILDMVTTHSASKVKKIDTSAPLEIGMAAGTDGDKHSKKGTEKPLNSQRKQCAKEQEPQVDGMEERVPTGVCRHTSTAVRVKKERIVQERDSGPRRKLPRETWQW